MNQRRNLSHVNIESTISGWRWNNAYNFCDKELDWIKNLSITEVIEFLQATGIILCNKICPDCNEILTQPHYNATRNPFFRCSKRSCRRQRFSAFKNSIFEHSKLSIKKILTFLYNFCCRRSVGDSSETLEITKNLL